MPQECKELVNNLDEFISVTVELLFSIPFHKLWRTKKWKRLVNTTEAFFTYAKCHVDQKIKEIEEGNVGEDVQAELGMDFLTYMGN